jgi:hypothetical protein
VREYLPLSFFVFEVGIDQRDGTLRGIHHPRQLLLLSQWDRLQFWWDRNWDFSPFYGRLVEAGVAAIGRTQGQLLECLTLGLQPIGKLLI